MKKRVMLYFGSFNPIHKGHIALAEYVVDQALCDEVVFIVSPQSPQKQAEELAPEMERFELVEAACAGSRYPERIKASAVEFLLPKPSYTIDTLRYLEECGGDRMQFSILMGADQIERLASWKEHEKVLAYPIYVYPRAGARSDAQAVRAALPAEVAADISAGQDVANVASNAEGHAHGKSSITVLANAPLQDISATEIREQMQRGTERYRRSEWGEALNAFNRVIELSPWYKQAREFVEIIREILDFRYKDIYNP